MGKIEQEYLKERGVEERISFKNTPEVKGLKIIKRESDVISGTDGREVQGIKYFAEHEQQQKTFFTSSISLIMQLANYKDGDIVNIICKSFKTPQGYRSKYIVSGNKEELLKKELPEEDVNRQLDEVSNEELDSIDTENIPF